MGVDRTARLAFSQHCFVRLGTFLYVENYILEKCCFTVSSQVLTDRPHRHGRLSSLDMPG